jgi:hypothetical protein
MTKVNIGKICDYTEIVIKKTDSSKCCVLYDVEKMKKKNQEKKCIRIVFHQWYDTVLGHAIQKNIQLCQYYRFLNQWKLYYDTPLIMYNNPYNYTALMT